MNRAENLIRVQSFTLSFLWVRWQTRRDILGSLSLWERAGVRAYARTTLSPYPLPKGEGFNIQNYQRPLAKHDWSRSRLKGPAVLARLSSPRATAKSLAPGASVDLESSTRKRPCL